MHPQRRGGIRPAVLALPLLASAALGGCAALGPLAAAGAGSVALVQRTPPDFVVSVVTGLDCSVVRLANNKSYCKPVEPPPQPPQYCTKSLAGVDCWDRPHPFGYYQRGLADGPVELTEEQEFQRTAPWLVGKIF